MVPDLLVRLEVHAQHQLRRDRRASVVEGGIAVVVLKLLQPPAIAPDGLVPALERPFAPEVVDVVPAALRALGPLYCQGSAASRPEEALLARGVVRVKEEMANRRRARRLDPAHGAISLHLAELPAEVRRVGPNVA